MRYIGLLFTGLLMLGKSSVEAELSSITFETFYIKVTRMQWIDDLLCTAQAYPEGGLMGFIEFADFLIVCLQNIVWALLLYSYRILN